MTRPQWGQTPLLVLLALLALGGCASLSEKQCESGDWTAIGRKDGERGLEASEFERHRDACQAHGVTPDAERYRAGRDQGLAVFCTPRGGYVAGRRGDSYREVCPAASADKFLAAFRRGREVNVVVRDVKELRRSLDELEAAAMTGDYAPEDRTQMRFRADELNQRLRMKEWDVERLDRKYARQFDAPELDWVDLRY